MLAVLLRSYSEETADYTFQTDAKSDTMVHTCTSDSTTIGTSRINNSHITTFSEDYEVVEPCRKQAFLQIQNLFAAKINSKDDEKIYPLTVQEIADAKLAHPQYKNYFRDKVFKNKDPELKLKVISKVRVIVYKGFRMVISTDSIHTKALEWYHH